MAAIAFHTESTTVFGRARGASLNIFYNDAFKTTDAVASTKGQVKPLTTT